MDVHNQAKLGGYGLHVVPSLRRASERTEESIACAAPELLGGDVAAAPTPASDVYALGMTLVRPRGADAAMHSTIAAAAAAADAVMHSPITTDAAVHSSMGAPAAHHAAAAAAQFKLFAGRRPFSGRSRGSLVDLAAAIVRGDRPDPAHLSAAPRWLVGTITACWAADPRRRPEAADVVSAFAKQAAPG